MRPACASCATSPNRTYASSKAWIRMTQASGCYGQAQSSTHSSNVGTSPSEVPLAGGVLRWDQPIEWPIIYTDSLVS